MASIEEPVHTPDWILRLENKNKRTHKLAHEIGAGASCLQCNSCPGLDLHFWRKLCKKCKCKKEEHDVKDDDGCEQFEILLGVGHKKQTPKRAYLNIRVAGTGIENAPAALKTENTSSSKDAVVSFDWVPPNVTSDLAEEYMLQLPTAKLPISGSDGAQYRRMQLEKQVPIHDLDASKCHGLTSVEVDRMQAYVDEIKTNVVGQGRVTKLLDPVKYEEQRLKHTTPHAGLVSAEPVRAHGVRQNTGGIMKQPAPHSAIPHNANVYGDGSALPASTPPTSSPKKAPGSSGHHSSAVSPLPPFSHSSDEPPDSPPPPLPANPPPMMDPASQSNFGLGDILPMPGQRVLKTPGSMIPPSLGGYSTNLNDRIGTQGGRSGAKYDLGEHPGKVSSGEDLEWPPPPSYEEISGSNGMVGNGVPGSDKISPENELPDLMGSLRVAGDGMSGDGAVDTLVPQWKCHRCEEQVKAGEVVVVAERAGENVCWHPQCFVCNVCKELLVDLIYFFRKGEVYCGRHFAEIMNIPRCNACDELIFVPNYTSAEGRSYHVKHFCCFECDIPLGGMKYILVDDQPNCLNCYQIKYGKTCHTCKQPIAAGDQRVSWKELHWHVSANCFCCVSCKKFLLGGRFTVKENQPFCSRTCVETYFCPQTAL